MWKVSHVVMDPRKKSPNSEVLWIFLGYIGLCLETQLSQLVEVFYCSWSTKLIQTHCMLTVAYQMAQRELLHLFMLCLTFASTQTHIIGKIKEAQMQALRIIIANKLIIFTVLVSDLALAKSCSWWTGKYTVHTHLFRRRVSCRVLKVRVRNLTWMRL